MQEIVPVTLTVLDCTQNVRISGSPSTLKYNYFIDASNPQALRIPLDFYSLSNVGACPVPAMAFSVSNKDDPKASFWSIEADSNGNSFLKIFTSESSKHGEYRLEIDATVGLAKS